MSHGHAATLSIEDSLKVTPPNNARLVRNLQEACQFLHSHILWFYILGALDYVDPTSALKADPKKAADLAVAAGTSGGDFAGVQKRLKALVDSGQLSIFTNGYAGHPTYKLPPELNLIAVAHYLESIQMQALANQALALFGGKFPHFMTSPPGGVLTVPTAERLAEFYGRIVKVAGWITNTMVPDLLAIAPFYLDYAGIGAGCKNFLAWGVFDEKEPGGKNRLLPRGAIFDLDPKNLKKTKVEQPDPNEIIEHVAHSWYTPNSGSRNPKDGVTEINFTDYSVDQQYSWAKAPRLKGKPMEVGPLARMLVAYFSKRKEVVTVIDDTLGKLSKAAGKKLGPEVLVSTLGRVAARVLEAQVVADATLRWFNELVANLKAGDAAVYQQWTTPAGTTSGVGLWEAPRGALAHWNTLSGGKISAYQVVAPSTWLYGPHDDKGVLGPQDAALIDTPVEEQASPLEIMRVVHSFDP